jgi:hypothetical protein
MNSLATLPAKGRRCIHHSVADVTSMMGKNLVGSFCA